MLVRKFWGLPNPVLRWRQASILYGLHSVDEFRKVLDRERVRTDRHDHEFSLVIFAIEKLDTDTASALVSVISHRARSTDELGWLNEEHLGVILPYTSFTGAEKFTDDICQLTQLPLAYAVYTYPSQWFPDENIYSRRRGFTAVSPAPDSSKSQEPVLSPKRASSDHVAPTPRPTASSTQTHATAEETFELFITQGIPVWKRAIDVIGALFALLLFSPLLLLITLLIKSVSPGPVLLKQERVGYLGRLFTIWKFRTMHLKTDSSVHQQYFSHLMAVDKPMTKLDAGNDPRLIPFGKVLRQSCLDELPQLINVLRGDMSLVGPRPCLPYEANEYLLWQLRRFDVLPGMTGLWQVSGKNRTTFKEMMRLDISYARVKSFLLDVKILLKTIPVIITEAFYSRRQKRTSGTAPSKR